MEDDDCILNPNPVIKPDERNTKQNKFMKLHNIWVKQNTQVCSQMHYQSNSQYLMLQDNPFAYSHCTRSIPYPENIYKQTPPNNVCQLPVAYENEYNPPLPPSSPTYPSFVDAKEQQQITPKDHEKSNTSLSSNNESDNSKDISDDIPTPIIQSNQSTMKIDSTVEICSINEEVVSDSYVFE